MYFIIYKITNKINDKIYIGQHTTSNINDGYMGSGILLKKAKIKYGINKFNYEILELCTSADDLNNAEFLWIKKLESLNPKGYNLRPGGSQSPLSPESIEKMKISRRGQFMKELNPNWKAKSFNSNTRNKISESIKERYKKYPSYKNAISKTSKNRKHSNESKNKISISNIGEKNGRYIKFSNDEICEIIYLYTSENISLTKIGKKFKISPQTIKRCLMDNNIFIIKRVN